MGKPKKNNGRNDRTLSRVSRDFSSTSFKDSSVYDDVDLGNVEPQQSSTLPKNKKFSRKTTRRASTISQIFQKRHISFGLITFFALKIIFIDIFVALGDLVSDFWQGIELLLREGLHSYGWIIIGVNWVPGLVASMHIIHMYRTKLPAKKTLLYTVMAFVLWPIIPLGSYIFLLWRKPTDMEPDFGTGRKSSASSASTISSLSTTSTTSVKHRVGRVSRKSPISSFKSTASRRSLKHNYEEFKRSFKGSLKRKRNLESATMSNLKRATPEEREHLLSNFETAEYFSMLASAISGGIESPIQFVTQMWLVLTGRLDVPWAPNWHQFKDWNGNPIYIPSTALFSLCFSFLAMIKAVVYFNIARVHVSEITSSRRMWWFVVLIFDHLPYFMASLIFKVGSILILAVYLPWGLIVAVPLIILCNLIIGYSRFNLETIPLWLISFVGVFFPACFTSQKVDHKNRHHMVNLQYHTFRRQTISSTVVLEASLLVTLYMINCVPTYNYDHGVILDNSDFNILVSVIGSVGILSVFLSIKPSWLELFKSMNEKIARLDRLHSLDDETPDELEEERRKSFFVCQRQSTVSIKSILKQPKLGLIKEEDENVSSKSTPQVTRKEVSDENSSETLNSSPEVERIEMETQKDNRESQCSFDVPDGVAFHIPADNTYGNEFEKNAIKSRTISFPNKQSEEKFEKKRGSNEEPKKKLPKYRIIRILGGKILSLVILAFLLVPLSTHYFTRQKNKSYLYYQLPPVQDDIKETRIIQGIIFNNNKLSNNVDLTCGTLQKEGSFEALESYFLGLQISDFSQLSDLKVSTPDHTNGKVSMLATRRFKNYPVFPKYEDTYYDNNNQRFKRSGLDGGLGERSGFSHRRSCRYRAPEWKDDKCESPCDDIILMVCRSAWGGISWPKVENKIGDMARLRAIIVVDDNKGCGEDKSKNCFRPSYPYPKVPSDAPSEVPMVLVQGIDIFNIYEKKKEKCWTNCVLGDTNKNCKCDVGISGSNDTIPEEVKKYKCVGSNDEFCPGSKISGQIPLDDLVTYMHQIKGEQKRRIKCMWGGSKCDGYYNEDETQPYCDQADTRYLFCDKFKGESRLYWTSIPIELPIRSGRFFKALSKGGRRNDPERECVNEENINECGKQSPGWSDETTWVKIEDKYQKYRYCEVKRDDRNSHSCVLEEIFEEHSNKNNLL